MLKSAKKLLFVLISATLSLFLLNWSQNLSSPEYCSGTVYFPDSKTEKVIDIKIGTSKAVADNKDIKFYRKPASTDIKEKDFIEYHIDLKRISHIETNQVEPVTEYEKKEYVNVKVVSPSGIEIECVVPKDQELMYKVKSTGWTSRHPFNTIKKIAIEHCAELQETTDDSRKSKEVAVNDFKRACDELEKHQADRQLKNLRHNAENVLENLKNNTKDK